MSDPPPVVEATGVVKNYSGLRPLRIASLAVRQGERIALHGIDAPGAEVFINLMTGASLPDAGEIRVFGRSTASLADGDEWLSSLEMYGIVSDRAVLLEAATVAQNLALPLTLDIEPLAAETRAQVESLAAECEIEPEWLQQRTNDVPPGVRVRMHLARALALGPRLLLLEHPTAMLPETDRAPFGALLARVCEARALTAIAVTADQAFAGGARGRTLTLQPATGQLVAARRRWGLFQF
jgi:ABC-type transporter Mla maintaining outer membrane lipid asymmetry ATPase subunit MlaF